MNIKNYISLLLTLLCLQSSNIFPVVSTTVPSNITTKVFDRATGNLYLGLEEPIVEGAPSIVAFKRFHGYGTPQYQTVVPASDNLIASSPIEFLTLATSRGNVNPLLAVVTKKLDEPNSQTTVLAYSSNFASDSKKGTSDNLVDAISQTTTGIVALAASETHIFAAVKPNQSPNDPPIFGDPDSGIAVVTITQEDDSIVLTQSDAENGTTTSKAKRVDPTIDELKIPTYSTSDPIITVTDIGIEVCLHWDDKLQRLYIGIESLRTNTTTQAGARSIIVARVVNTNGLMSFAEIAPDTAFTPGATNQIVGAKKTAMQTPLTIGALYLRTMHTSTGKSYLIVNGGNGVMVDSTTVVPGNRIFALPLVDVNDPANIKQGTLANIENPTFTQTADTPSELFTNQDPQANVGGGPFPLKPDKRISDIVVVGDTVYVSTKESQNSTDNTESGIWYSQALFDEYGTIYRWTPWTKRAFPGSTTKIKLFDVDAANGKLWAINDQIPTQVLSTAWIRAQDTKETDDLRELLNRDFACGCFAVLDLDQSTRRLAQESPARYALFGGMNQVAFVKISESQASKDPYDRDLITDTQYIQDVTINFDKPENYLLTALPVCAGCVKVLEYSRTFNTNYFFAGTQKGLYVFANREKEAFPINKDVNNLNAEPFISRRWQPAPNISGSIIDLKSDGNFLYVLTFETSNAKPIKNCLYKIKFEDTVAAMFTSGNIIKIAESAVTEPNSDLSAAKMFFAIQIMTTKDGNDFINEIVLATNNGIYTTNGVFSAGDQEGAAWQPVDDQDTSMYTGIFAVDNIPTETTQDYQHELSTVWPIQVADGQNCFTFEKSNIRQLNGSSSTDLPTFMPVNFNATPSGNFETDKEFETLDPISYFWSDGARRFFIMQRLFDPNWVNKIFVIPYNTLEWSISDPDTMLLTDPALKQIKTFYWIRHIGATGILMAGTDSGVVSLE